ncbi:MAG: hypothetical protein DIZ80_16600 [endosymbiont of Galathealinum brachiosum]|uniref:Sel1 repeat family protein n=1 Tax=endosymbiont of Galathealinum brachiosum TaxID=2200906 RepID=A0A370D6C9_9GAMM|nr:MAG: hypothetical protein DIZ80_16600 [endosymbiont of Galathealinum brachiosum]
MNIKHLKLNILLLLLINSMQVNLYADTYDSSASVFRFQKEMAKRGNAESQFKLGLMYETGSGIKKSPVLAIIWYKKAEFQNYKPASNRLTYLEIKENGFREKHEEWLKKLKTDARFHEGEALFLLGQMYSEGTGVNKSLTRSLKLLRKAAGGNIPGSDTEIARVEAELAQLQDQYLTEEEKQNIVPIVILPVKKAVTTPPVATPTKITPTVAKTTKTGNIKTTKSPAKKPVQKTKTVKKETKAKNQQAKLVTEKSKPVIKTAPPKAEVKDEDHPMDMICGGRNRFSRGCR